jgi:hypothetical protein
MDLVHQYKAVTFLQVKVMNLESVLFLGWDTCASMQLLVAFKT